MFVQSHSKRGLLTLIKRCTNQSAVLYALTALSYLAALLLRADVVVAVASCCSYVHSIGTHMKCKAITEMLKVSLRTLERCLVAPSTTSSGIIAVMTMISVTARLLQCYAVVWEAVASY
jgi:hypothetical protein